MNLVKIAVENYDSEKLVTELESRFAEDGLQLELSVSPIRHDGFYLSPEAGLIIVSGIANIALIINSVLVFIANRRSGDIELVDSKGIKFKIPRGTSKKELESYLETFKTLHAELSHISIKL